MKVLVTGGAGFIGSRLSVHLSNSGHEVTVVDNLSGQVHGEVENAESGVTKALGPSVRFVRGCVTDPQIWEKLIPGQDAIVHLAAETGTGQSMYEIHQYTSVNIGGTALMLDYLANNPSSVRRIVVASSRAVCGEGKYVSPELGIVYPSPRSEADLRAGRFDPRCPVSGQPMQPVATGEDAIVRPTSVYGITKLNQEQMVVTVGEALGIPAIALRYQNVYGPGQSLRNPYTGILSIFSTRIFNGNRINIFEDGLETRDFVYIDDVVDATTAAVTSDASVTGVYCIGSGSATTVMEVATELQSAYSSSVPVDVTGDFRLGDIRHNWAATEKAARDLGFKPKTDFKVGIARFAAWASAQVVEEDNYESALSEMGARGLMGTTVGGRVLP